MYKNIGDRFQWEGNKHNIDEVIVIFDTDLGVR